MSEFVIFLRLLVILFLGSLFILQFFQKGITIHIEKKEIQNPVASETTETKTFKEEQTKAVEDVTERMNVLWGGMSNDNRNDTESKSGS